MTKLDDITWQK